MNRFVNNRLSYCLNRAVIAVITASALLFTDMPAYADGSFLLQLGTFESREEAGKKWDEVKNANGDVVGTLKGHVAEVMLPPDNTPTYRMQVGPLASRREARKACKTLESRNVQCFVVETAFAASDLSPEMAGDVSPPAPADPVKATPDVAPAAPVAPPAEQISSAPVAPIEPAPAVAETPETVAKAAVRETEVAEARAPRRSVVQTAHRGTRNFNPNDMKKSGFFRGTFNTNDEETTPAEETVAQAETPAPVAAKR